MATLTAQMEGFSQDMAAGELGQADCYRAHYDCSNMLPATVDQCASRLANGRKIAARIQFLRDQDAQKLAEIRVWDKARFIDEAESNLKQSRELDQMAPANGALTMIGKATGIIQETVTPSQTTAVQIILKVAEKFTLVELEARVVQSKWFP